MITKRIFKKKKGKIPCLDKSCNAYDEEYCSCIWKISPSMIDRYINDKEYAKGICPTVKESLDKSLTVRLRRRLK